MRNAEMGVIGRASFRIVRIALAGALCVSPRLALAAGGEKATPLENVADTRDLTPGFSKFLADTYNGNLSLYALYGVLIMVAMGVLLGFTADKLMSLTGISLGKADHHE